MFPQESWYKVETPGWTCEPENRIWCETRSVDHQFSNIFLPINDVMVWYFEDRFDAIWFALTVF